MEGYVVAGATLQKPNACIDRFLHFLSSTLVCWHPVSLCSNCSGSLSTATPSPPPPPCQTSSTSRPVDLREHVVSDPSLRASSQKIHILCEWPFPGPFICSIIHSGWLLGTYCVPDTVLGIRDTTVKRQTFNPPGA